MKDSIIRNRYFCAILYEEDPNYKKYIKNIQKNFKEVTWIDHARDIKEENQKEELKKKHTHILFKVGENARHRNAIAKIIEIAPNYIEGCNKDAMLMYLIHANNPEKTQYNIEEVQGELKEYLRRKLAKKEPQENKLEFLVENINNKNIVNEYQLIKWAINTRKYRYITKV